MGAAQAVRRQTKDLREKVAASVGTRRQRSLWKWGPATGAVLGALVVGLVVAEVLTLRRALK